MGNWRYGGNERNCAKWPSRKHFGASQWAGMDRKTSHKQLQFRSDNGQYTESVTPRGAVCFSLVLISRCMSHCEIPGNCRPLHLQADDRITHFVTCSLPHRTHKTFVPPKCKQSLNTASSGPLTCRLDLGFSVAVGPVIMMLQ